MKEGIFLWRGLTYEILGVAGRPCHAAAKLAKKLGSAIKTPSHLFPLTIQTYFTSNVQKKTLSSIIDISEMFNSEEFGVVPTR